MTCRPSTKIPSIPNILRALADALEAQEANREITQAYYSVPQAAAYLGVSPRTVQRRIDDGELKLRKGGIQREELEAYASAEVEKKRTQSEPVLTPFVKGRSDKA